MRTFLSRFPNLIRPLADRAGANRLQSIAAGAAPISKEGFAGTFYDDVVVPRLKRAGLRVISGSERSEILAFLVTKLDR